MPGGGQLRYSTFRHHIWEPTLRAVGLPVMGLHVLRHSAAAAMIHAGASPKTVQKVLGHASAAFTLTVYGHVFEADLDHLGERLERVTSRAQTGPGRDRAGSAAPSIAVLPTKKGL